MAKLEESPDQYLQEPLDQQPQELRGLPLEAQLLDSLRYRPREIADLVKIRELLDAGADINAVDDRGETALMWAAQDHHNQALELLVARGADVNIQDEQGNTALIHAVAAKDLDAILALVEAGADPRIANIYGRNAFDHSTLHEDDYDSEDALTVFQFINEALSQATTNTVYVVHDIPTSDAAIAAIESLYSKNLLPFGAISMVNSAGYPGFPYYNPDDDYPGDFTGGNSFIDLLGKQNPDYQIVAILPNGTFVIADYAS